MRARAIGLLVLSGAVSLGGCNRVLGPTNPDARWNVIETARFSLHVRPGSFAEQNAAQIGHVLEDQYDATLASLETHYSDRITAMLYDSARDAGLPSDRSGTAFPATAAFEASCTPPYDANLMSLLAHEANHVVQQNALGPPGTSMLNEGLASAVLSERYHLQGRTFYYAWTRNHRGQVPPIAKLADDGQWNDVPDDLSYSASASFLAYLLETGGATRLKQLWGVRSGEFERRFQQIYGRPLAGVEGDWLAFCDRR